ncbi:MAG: Panacea domain-containing protein [Janthinobacterium lividum]
MPREIALSFQPQFDKIVELMLLLAHKYPGLSKYQVVKIFYLSDKLHLERYKRPLSFDTYFALWYGPVASNAMDLMEQDDHTFKLAGITELPFEVDVRPDHKNRPIAYIGKPLREIDEDMFSESDTEVFEEVANTYKSKTFDELMTETHKHQAYKLAWFARGTAKRGLMDYADMIEDSDLRERIVDDIAPLAQNLR